MTKHIVEIQGVKMEVDTRHAKVLHENLKVGSTVKILKKEYSDKRVYPGIIIGFDNFKDLPTINVMYIEPSYPSSKLKFVAINEDTKDTQMVPDMDDTVLSEVFSQESIMKQFDSEIEKKRQEIEEIEAKKAWFNKYFGLAMKKVAEEAEPVLLG